MTESDLAQLKMRLETGLSGRVPGLANSALGNFPLEEGQNMEKKKPEPASKKVRVKTISGREITARKMQVGLFSVICQTGKLGENGPSVMTESSIILINRDHRLYKRFQKNTEALTLYVTGLIAQEIARTRTIEAKEAFLLQNQIISDAWA